jgi:hypothetical protein
LLWCSIGIYAIGFGIILFLDRTGRIDWTVLKDRVTGRWHQQQQTDYRSIPPHLMPYQQTAVFRCPVIGQPTCFAVQNDSTFIIGTADPPALSFFDSSGMFLRKIDLPEEPKALVYGTSETILTDKIVVAHSQNIAIYTAEGDRETLRLHRDKKSDIQSLVLTPDYLFAADTGKRCIYRLHEQGTLDLTFGNTGESEDSFIGFVVYASPITMTFSPLTGLLFITNPGKHRIEVFTQDGIHRPELGWGEPSAHVSGFAGCCNPIGLAVLDDGRILTVEKAVSRIKIFKQDTYLDCVVAGPGTLESLPPGVERAPLKSGQRYFAAAVLSEGRIAVFDFEYAAIRIFAPLQTAQRQ